MKPKKDNQCCEECADVDFEKTWPAHTATQFCASSNCPCHQKDNQNISQGNCEQCKNLPEGEVIKGHDHRIQKDNQESWEKEFEEKFIANDILDCIPEENWEEMKGEVFNFIHNLLTSQRQSLLEEVEKKIAKKIKRECSHNTCEHDTFETGDAIIHASHCGYNSAISDILDLLRSKK